ncbi:pectate lyase [Aphelenchoides avenae]|nr:pectate lyase [Aphelenchus avenae]
MEDVGKLYRSCGNCKGSSASLPRKVVIDTAKATGPIKSLAGCNYIYGDSVTLRNIQVSGSVKEYCAYYEGNNQGKEPPVVKEDPTDGKDGDGKYCVFKASDITKA